MTFLPADRLPPDSQALALRKEARAVLDAYEAFLGHPAFVHRVDLSILAKIAADENAPLRERRRAAEVLAHLRLRVLEQVSTLTCVKEQILEQLGIAPAPAAATAVAIAQAITRIEVVREKDWRDAATSDDRG